MKKRKILYSVILILVLIVCLAAGWFYNIKSYSVFDKQMTTLKNESNPGEARMVNAQVQNENYFITAKADREKARAKAIDGYNKMLQNPDISSEGRKNCEDALKNLNTNIAKEADAEMLIKAKGIKNVIVFINENSVVVTVDSPKLTSPEISRIKDVLSDFVSTKNIKIVEVG